MKNYWRYAKRWLWENSNRALEKAYNTVLKIKGFDSNTTLVNLNKETQSEKPRFLAERSNKLTSEERLEVESLLDKSGFLPRSISRTFSKLKKDLTPNTESEIIGEFRNSRYRTITSIRYLLILILIPLLVNQISKDLIIKPWVESFWSNNQLEIFLNSSQEEEAFLELKNFEENIRFQSLLEKPSEIFPEDREEKIKKKANKIAQKYKIESINAVANIFADILSVSIFITLILVGKQKITILKSFIDEIFYSLSDSAKAFLIILSTDMFVGFHSPHGWEVIIENILKHFGLPENKNFTFLFIATFPVILDSIFKYWIFRYLNRISPSAVATYRNMNE